MDKNQQPTSLNSDQALQSVQRANRVISYATIVALVILIFLIGIALLRLNDIASSNAKNIAEHRYQVETANEKAKVQIQIEAQKNRQRLDTILCIVSAPVTTRSPAQVDACYPGGSLAKWLEANKQ